MDNEKAISTDIENIDFEKLLFHIHPGLYQGNADEDEEGEHIKDLALWLGGWDADSFPAPVPDGISFGLFEGDKKELIRSVGEVDESWVRYFMGRGEIYCALDGDRVAAFALISDMGSFNGLKIGGPGCVGTVPEYRKKGIGKRIVKDITAILKERGYDLSYVYYTYYGDWYGKLGYRVVTERTKKKIIRTFRYGEK